MLSLILALACAPHPVDVPVPEPIAAEDGAYDSVYFVLIDRFANGDPTNDGDVDLADPQAFHGGDLAGVLAHLDHIESMGFRTVWLSPVYAMRTAKFMGHGAFHGYWVQDLSAVEPRFGTEADLRALADELHRRDMRLIMDMVWNHVSFDAPLVDEHPEYFHERLPIEDWDDPVELQTHEVHGLRDLAQERPDVFAFLEQISVGWVERVGPDGFRIDAVRHMPLDAQAHLMDAAREASARPFFTLGEVFDGDPVRLSESWEGGGFDSVFDFPLRYAMIDHFCKGRPVGRLGAVLSADRVYADANRIVTFLDNHDVSRVVSECGGDVEAVGRALDFLLSVRGIPSVYQGTEIGSEGATEPDNRADMRFGVGHPLESRIRDDLTRRRSHVSLTQGRTRIVHLSDDLLVTLRIHADETAVVAVNAGSEPATDPAAPGVELAPGVTVAFLPGRAWIDPGTRRLRLTATGLPLAEGEVPVLVGTGRELANWTPADGLPLQEQGGAWVLATELPADQVLEYKLVLRGADGDLRWQDGENRYLFLPAGEGPVEAEVAW